MVVEERNMARDIRSAKPSDVPEIQSVATDAWHEAHAPIIGADTVEEFLAEYYDTESFYKRVRDETAILDVATDTEGDVVGYVLASPMDDDQTTFDLTQIYVDPRRWGDGIGQQLLDHLEQKIRNRGGELISLGVMVENDRAVRFYEAAGYEQANEVYDDRIETTSYIYEKRVQ